MRSLRHAVLGLLLVGATSSPALADITAFLGASTTPANRPVTGAALGSGLLVAGFEFEYSAAAEDLKAGAPSLRVGSVNGLLQTPVPVFGVQPYATVGAGIYRERLGTSAKTGVGTNVGGGVKIALAGPLRLRIDYRMFRQGGSARYSPSHRIYAGLNVKF